MIVNLHPGTLLGLGFALLLSLTGCEPTPLSNVAESERPAVQQALSELQLRSKSDMVWIEGGTFNFGFLDYRKAPVSMWSFLRIPSTEVTLDGYFLSRFQVTLKDYLLYRKVQGYPANPYPLERDDLFTEIDHIYQLSVYENKKMHDYWATMIAIAEDYAIPAQLPWSEAQRYCEWLGQLSGVPGSLATSAQWEFAARNRGRDDVFFATDNSDYDLYINTPHGDDMIKFEILLGSSYDLLLPIGWYPPSPLGIYDLRTNGNEWMYDWYDLSYYDGSPKINPTGPKRSRYTQDEAERWGWGDIPSKTIRGSYPISYYAPTISFSGRVVALIGGEKFDSFHFDYSTARCVINSDGPLP